MVQSRLLWDETVDKLDVAVDGWQIRERTVALERVENVEEIDLSYRGMYFPDTVGGESFILDKFRSLCWLDLSHSQLRRLPEAIGSLPSLTHLFLNDNDLLSLEPRIIRRLVNLQELDLRNNVLHDFPLDITELSCLQRLSVRGNPLHYDETRKLMKLAHSERWIDIAGECKILW